MEYPIPPIAFLHLPKAGGTSITSALKRFYPQEDIAPFIESSPTERNPAQWNKYRGYKYAAGHCGYEVVTACFPKSQLITNFRHPVSRILSLYRYWRSFDLSSLPDHLQSENGPKYARQMSFSEFVASGVPFLSLYLDNFHTRQLTISGWMHRTISPSALVIAAWRIYHMRWFYVCEHPDASAEWLKRAFPAFAGIEIDYENRTPNGSVACTVSTADRSVILSRNRYDHLLYQFAVFLLGRRSALGQLDSRSQVRVVDGRYKIE